MLQTVLGKKAIERMPEQFYQLFSENIRVEVEDKKLSDTTYTHVLLLTTFCHKTHI